jgi:hypothetical protein
MVSGFYVRLGEGSAVTKTCSLSDKRSKSLDARAVFII